MTADLLDWPDRPAQSSSTPWAAPYLLVSGIPTYLGEYGSVWVDDLWHRDLVEHFNYLPALRLAAPVRPKGDVEGLVRLDVPSGASFELVPLPGRDTWFEAVRGAPATFARLWGAAGEASIVHSSVAGWPFPLGWLANIAALLRGRRLVIVVESAPWRVVDAAASLKRRLVAAVTERMARAFVHRADLTIFTQPRYREALFGDGARGVAEVAPATWINEEDILSVQEAEASWCRRPGSDARLLFAGRLCHEKGLTVLLDALARLDARGVSVAVDLIGQGPMRAAAVAAAAAFDSVRLRVLDPVPYGAPFFGLLRDYEAVLVPSCGDEQPRIVFDAFSQAVPVVASDTDGLASIVADGETGWLVPRGDPAAMADRIADVWANPDACRARGLRGLAWARGATHRGMHDRRRRLLLSCFGPG